MEYVIFIGILLVLSIAMAMDLSWNNVITAERNTMVFADRNREYGAYVLRRDYVKRLLIAVVGSVLVFGLAVGLPKIIAAMGGEEEVVEVKKIVDVNLDLFEEEKKEEPPPPPVEPPPPSRSRAYSSPSSKLWMSRWMNHLPPRRCSPRPTPAP